MSDNNRLHKIFNTGQNEIDQMKENLAKLYNLTDEDKSEESFLQSRIEEQSNLIMMLKKRADEYLLRCQVVEKENKELEEKLQCLNDKNKVDDKKSRILFQNYNKLSHDYEEMKVNYVTIKESNEKMKIQLEILKREISVLNLQLESFSDSGILKDEMVNLKTTNHQLELKIKDLNESYNEKFLIKGAEIKTMQETIDFLNQNLKEKEIDLKLIKTKSESCIEKLKADQIMSLNDLKTMKTQSESQELIIKKNNAQIKELTETSKKYEKLYTDLKIKYAQESENINVNVQIKNLKSELQNEETKFRELRQDYEAYKVYSNKLLQTEKELSSRLRKLYS